MTPKNRTPPHLRNAVITHSSLFMFVALMVSLSTGCWLANLFSPENLIFEAAKNTAPVVEPISSKAASKAAWTVGNPMFELFSMLQDYDPTASGGGGDLKSLYYVIYTAGRRCSDCEQWGTPISPTLITSPYAFGQPGATYDRYRETTNPAVGSPPGTNYVATRKEGDSHSFLITWVLYRTDLADEPIERVVLQGSYDEAVGTLVLDCSNLLASATSKMASRYHVEGNASTHHFGEFLAARWNWFSGQPGFGYRAWYVGTGYARGAGQKFLFKIADNGPLLTPPGKYFEFPADADETTLQGMSDTGSDTTTLTDYQAVVDTLVSSGAYYDVITDNPTEVPTSASDFTGTGDGNMKPMGMP